MEKQGLLGSSTGYGSVHGGDVEAGSVRTAAAAKDSNSNTTTTNTNTTNSNLHMRSRSRPWTLVAAASAVFVLLLLLLGSYDDSVDDSDLASGAHGAHGAHNSGKPGKGSPHHHRHASPSCPVRLPQVHPHALVTETRARLASLLPPLAPNTSIVLAAAPRFLRPESDMDLPGYRQTGNIMYLLGPFFVSDALVVVSLPPAAPTAPLVRASSSSSASASSAADADADAAANNDSADAGPYTEDPTQRLHIEIFLPVLTQRQAVFNRPPLEPSVVRDMYKVSAVHSIANVTNVLAGRTLLTAGDPAAIHAIVANIPSDLGFPAPGTAFPPAPPTPPAGPSDAKPVAEPVLQVTYMRSLDNAFRFARQVKTPAERAHLTYASQVAAWTHAQVGRYIETHDSDADVMETTLASTFEDLSTVCGARLQAYNPIVGAGPHSAVLHYPTGESEDGGYTPITRGQFVLIDAAGAYQGYASDLTRTYVRKNAWTPLMRRVHNIVANAQHAAMAEFRDGNPWARVIAASARSITQQLLQYGYLKGDLETLLADGVVFAFMPHGVGHRIGLDVHDPIPLPDDAPAGVAASSATTDADKTAFVAAMRDHGIGFPSALSLHPWQTAAAADLVLEPGSAMTIEPGVYFIPYLLDIMKNDPKMAGHINFDRIERDGLVKLGGVRIEDVLMINDLRETVVITKPSRDWFV